MKGAWGMVSKQAVLSRTKIRRSRDFVDEFYLFLDMMIKSLT